MFRRFVPVFALLALLACSPAPKQAAAPTEAPAAVVAPATANDSHVVAAAFLCADSTQIFALFRTGPGQASEVALAIDDDRLHLPQLVSASGARYADSSTTFWNKGDSATFTRGGTTTTCHVVK
ncbi:MAG: MliC family protein [Gemmatimonadota bacterium]